MLVYHVVFFVLRIVRSLLWNYGLRNQEVYALACFYLFVLGALIDLLRWTNLLLFLDFMNRLEPLPQSGRLVAAGVKQFFVQFGFFLCSADMVNAKAS